MQGIEIEEAFVRDFGRKIGKGSHVSSRKGTKVLVQGVREHLQEAKALIQETKNHVQEATHETADASEEGTAHENSDASSSDRAPQMKQQKVEQTERKMKYAFYVYVLILTALFCSLFVSCTTVKYVPVESSTSIKDSLRIRDSLVVRNVVNQKDSVILRDSVVQVVDENGKVIRTELYRYKEVNRNLTIENERLKKELEEARTHKVDSVQVPVLIEKPLSRWQQFKLDVGEIAFLAIGVLILKLIFEMVKKKHPS